MSSQRAAVAPPMASAVRAACAIVRLTIVTWLHALRLHVLRRELAHLAGAEDDDVAAVEVAEDLSREGDGRVADRDRARAEVGFRPHALADGEARVEEAIEQRAGGVGLPGGAVRLFDLAENLRFADDQRVEAGGDAEQMPRGFEIRDVVDVRLDRRRVDVVERADERHQLGSRRRPHRRTRCRARRGCRSRARRSRRSRPGLRDASVRSASSTPRAWKSTRSRTSIGAVR